MSAPPPSSKYQDHYSVLGVDPKAGADVIHKAYSALAARYHPRNSDTRDQIKYEAVTRAYEILSDPDARRAFDALLPKSQVESTPIFGGLEFFDSLSAENNRRLCILCILYDRRRKNPAVPSISIRHLEAMVNFSSDALLFSLWYLKQRNWVISDDKSSLQITVEGMDYLERNSPSPELVFSLLKPGATGEDSETTQ